MPDLSVRIDLDVMDVLFSFDSVSSGLAKDRPQLGGGLFPLGTGEAFGPDDELALGRHGDDRLGHAELLRQKRTRMVSAPSAFTVRWMLP